MKNDFLLSLLIVLLGIALESCRPKLSAEEECSYNIQTVDRFLEQYFENGNHQELDSAMVYINKVNCDKYTAVTAMYKARIYYEEGCFPDAIKSINAIPDILFDFPTLKFLLIGELESKWAKAENDPAREREVYIRQDAILRDTIIKKWPLYDSILKAITDQVRIDDSEAVIVISHYFYNKVKFIDNTSVLLQIDSMHNIVNGGDPFFEELRHIIMGDPDYIIWDDFF